MIVFIAIMIMVSTAFARTSISGGNSSMPTNDSELADRLRNVPDFKFKNHENGIGYGNCPVYTAPSEEAFRCADGKASCYLTFLLTQRPHAGMTKKCTPGGARGMQRWTNYGYRL